MDFNTVIAAGALILTILGAVWTQGLWISKQFSILKDFVNMKVDVVMNKLEYHERHDDQRFNDISNRIWTVRLENAQDPRSKRYLQTRTTNESYDVGRTETTP